MKKTPINTKTHSSAGIAQKSLLVAGFRFQPFPNKKPADYKRCRILLNTDEICYGFRFDTGFGREWEIEATRLRIVFDEQVKGWWYV